MSFDPAKLAKGARNAAWRRTPHWLAHWREDITQDVVLAVLRQQKQHEAVNPALYDWAALKAVRHLCALLWAGYSPEPVDDESAGAVEPSEAPSAIAMWRLQRVWEQLTDLQQIALNASLSGDNLRDAEREHGLCRGVLTNARRTALARIDDPQAKRVCRRITLDKARPRSDDTAYRARDKARAQAARDARKAAT